MLEAGSKVAVVGAGISGITSAYLLSKRHAVTLYEKETRLGGHACTIPVSSRDGDFNIDIGFIVLNDRNYPLFNRLLEELGVSVIDSDMSFGYCDGETGFAYSGRSLNSIFAVRRNIVCPKFYGFLFELTTFCARATKSLQNDSLENLTLGEYLIRHKISNRLTRHYIYPMAEAIWSCGENVAKDYPVKAFLSFFKNHGLLELTNRPQWKTVVSGSQSYIRKFEAKFSGRTMLNSPVLRIDPGEHPVVTTEVGTEQYDAVVLATHAPTALKLFGTNSQAHVDILSPWIYTKNVVTLHTDLSLLPENQRAWASWNYLRKNQKGTVTYWMNNLQNLESETTYCVSLNSEPEPSKILYSTVFEHPVYSRESLRAQQRLDEIQGIGGIYFAGAYTGFGFHEDGCRSGVAVAKALGVEWI